MEIHNVLFIVGICFVLGMMADQLTWLFGIPIKMYLRYKHKKKMKMISDRIKEDQFKNLDI